MIYLRALYRTLAIEDSGRMRNPPMRLMAMSALTIMVMSMGRKDMGKRNSEK